MSSLEFVRWKVRIEGDWTRNTKQDFYMASIASEVRRSFVAKPENVKLDDFLLKFVTPDAKPAAMSEGDRQKQLSASKSFWTALAGVKTK